MRTQYIDPDFRRDPKTRHYCCACQRDLKPGQPHRMAMVVYSGFYFVHPEDWPEAASAPPFHGHAAEPLVLPVGMDCARRIGMEWTSPPEQAETGA